MYQPPLSFHIFSLILSFWAFRYQLRPFRIISSHAYLLPLTLPPEFTTFLFAFNFPSLYIQCQHNFCSTDRDISSNNAIIIFRFKLEPTSRRRGTGCLLLHIPPEPNKKIRRPSLFCICWLNAVHILLYHLIIDSCFGHIVPCQFFSSETRIFLS